jgi:hypothetical protein
MEGIARLVEDSMARHGIYVAADHRRLQWSPWLRCDSSFRLQQVPSLGGIYTLAEEIIAPGEIPSTGGKRMLAVFHVAETEDLCIALSRHIAPRGPFHDRLGTGPCFVRFAQVADYVHRQAACKALRQWLASSVETATGMTREFIVPFEAVSATRLENPTGAASDSSPPPLPSGF